MQLLLSHLQVLQAAKPSAYSPGTGKKPTIRACHREGRHSQPSLMLPGLAETQTAPSPPPLGLAETGSRSCECTYDTLPTHGSPTHELTIPVVTANRYTHICRTGIPHLQPSSNTCTDLPFTWHLFPNLGPPPSYWWVQLRVFWKIAMNTCFGLIKAFIVPAASTRYRGCDLVQLKPSLLSPLLVLIPLVSGFQDTHYAHIAAGRPPIPVTL